MSRNILIETYNHTKATARESSNISSYNLFKQICPTDIFLPFYYNEAKNHNNYTSSSPMSFKINTSFNTFIYCNNIVNTKTPLMPRLTFHFELRLREILIKINTLKKLKYLES